MTNETPGESDLWSEFDGVEAQRLKETVGVDVAVYKATRSLIEVDAALQERKEPIKDDDQRMRIYDEFMLQVLSLMNLARTQGIPEGLRDDTIRVVRAARERIHEPIYRERSLRLIEYLKGEIDSHSL